ncbi:membrane dipeptidase [Sphingobacterium mizutaii NBRC 14946 = DSM 11724]|uniref:Membrane dipeptidase (Peptidase family M19) n=2 Tax=Sphingobacterium mizutaii TaxID=1010 RepID=A0AAJ5BYK9_9SPHI|nr:dipeptidase [Sphingobacterium mizutaii]GEM68773.1 membrane dipeptidase [Sphingobacterium mizutaii NBRC 14946 = DSM 11724]SDL84732.1 membrane dipeptidase [Sphingobacterium mizutaii]SNV36543.1 Membrane dipeptidase (Peptidase family M19) [Sphingobacterium mizutaii]
MKKKFLLTILFGGAIFASMGQDYKQIHQDLIVVDGHNDVIVESILPGKDIGKRIKTGHTDLPRLKEGGVDVQVFAVWSDDKKWKKNAYKHANDQIDALEKLIANNPDKIELAKSSADIERINKNGKIVALIGIEGGNMIEERLDYLETLYNRGARYLTLTWNYNLPWVTAAAMEVKSKDKKGKGLTEHGKEIIRKMNELGMMVDLSHAGEQTFYDVLSITSKPVLVSHSNAAALTPHYRNLKDAQLEALKKNGGVVGVNFYSEFLDSNYPKRVKKLYYKTHKKDSTNKEISVGKMYGALSAKQKHEANAPFENVLKHIDHLVAKAGIDHVAIGSDFDGIESPPQELEDVTKFPVLTKALLERGYSKEDVAKIMGLNFLRVLKENEK